MDAKTKSAWVSKTYATNLVLASLVEIHPSIGMWVSTHPQTAILGCALINIVLRHFTTAGIHYGAKQ